MAAIAILLLRISGAAEAGELKPGFLVACPAFWPGLDAPGTPLDQRPGDWTPKVVDHFISPMILDDDGSIQVNDVAQLDCRYKGGRHLTVTLPGRDAVCRQRRHPEAPKVTTLVCEARVENGEPLKVVIGLAEKVTNNTIINEFKIRQSYEEILEGARRLCIDDPTTVRYNDGSPQELIFIDGNDDVISVYFAKSTKLSKKIVVLKKRQNGISDFYKSVSMRFGLERKFIDLPSMALRWSSDKGDITVDFVSGWPISDTLILTDHAAGE